MTWRLVVPALLLAGTACSDLLQEPDTGIAVLPGARISAVSGGDQIGFEGEPLADPLRARVTDRFGRPVEGVFVDWAAVAGGGRVSPDSSETDANGVATASWALGFDDGEQVAEASFDTETAVFTAFARPASGLTGSRDPR